MATIGQVIAQKQANDENAFFTNLLQYATLSDNISVPNKTDTWNQYVSLKKGRLGPGDINKFESQYSQIKSLIYQRQLKRLAEFSAGGESDRAIRKKVKENPDMYKNLLDMASDLKGDTTPEGMAMYAMTQNYLPQKTFADKMAAGEVGLMGRVGGPLALGAAITGAQYLAGRDVTQCNKDIKNQNKKLKRQKGVLSRYEKSGAKQSTLNKARSIVDKTNKELKVLKDTKATTPRRYEKLTSKIPKRIGLGPTLAASLLIEQSPYVAESLGFDRQTGKTAKDIAYGGMGVAGLSRALLGKGTIGTAIGGAGLLGYGIYDYLYGPEE